MYGTIFNMRPIRGQEQKVQELFENWERERNNNVEGVIGVYLFKNSSRPGIMVGVAIFDSKETFMKNANNPAQDRWYHELRGLLEDDPEWNDSEVILSAH
jgi:quinol monooxygenase YgiN